MAEVMKFRNAVAIAGLVGLSTLGLGACGSHGGLNAKPIGPMTADLLQSVNPLLTSCGDFGNTVMGQDEGIAPHTQFDCNYSPNGLGGAAESVTVTMNPAGGMTITPQG